MKYLLHINYGAADDIYYSEDSPQAVKERLVQYVRDWWDDEFTNNELFLDGYVLGDEVGLDDIKFYFEHAENESANIVVFNSPQMGGTVWSAEIFWSQAE